MNKLLLSLIIFGMTSSLSAQTLIPIPDTLSGGIIDLRIANSTHQFYSGFDTRTIGYNGSYLGPTIILQKGQSITMNVENQLSDTTTTHWHGLHVASMNDGSPHNPILPARTWSPSFTVMDHAATYWFHPHLHGKTLDQVMLGAAGLIIVRDETESALALPRTYGVDDIPLICQFQHMDNNTKQIILDDELDNITMVNGTIDPAVNVPAQVVRLRILNASSHRVLQFGFNDNRTFHQITSDDGLLNAPVELTRLRLGSGERAEILVNFGGQSGSTFFIRQYGNELPAGFPGGPSMMGGAIGPLDNKAFNFLQINVVEPTIAPVTAIPASLTTNVPWSTNGSTSRNFIIQGSPMMSMTNFTINSVQYDEEVNNFMMEEGDVMVWRITNQSMMAHPFHIHGNHFFITSLNGQTPPANMQGRKDVVLVAPMGGTATLITKYEDFCDPMMPYMYHCHILSHEDNGMMGQFLVECTTTAIHEMEYTTESMLVFPNPVDDELRIQWGAITENFTIQIFNAIGVQVLNTSTNNDIDVAALPQGMYLIRVHHGDKVRTAKFIKN